MNKIQASSTALECVMRMRWNRGARGKKDFSRWTGVFEKENQQSFHCVWSWDNTLLSCPSTHTHTHPYSPTFSHKSFDKWLAHRCCWSTPLHSCPCPSQHGNGGPQSYSTQQLPPPPPDSPGGHSAHPTTGNPVITTTVAQGLGTPWPSE